MKRIFPSLISADLLNLESEIKELAPHCDGFHVDVMDNAFVQNLTMGADFVNAIADTSEKQLFVHLMIHDISGFIDRLKLRPKDMLAFHYEATDKHHEIIKKIQDKDLLAGIAISPDTDPETIYRLLPKLDFVTVMSVQPGFSGQKFIPSTLEKVSDLARLRREKNLKFLIAGDGGINLENIGDLAQHGMDDFCIASAIFAQSDPITALKELYSKISNVE